MPATNGHTEELVNALKTLNAILTRLTEQNSPERPPDSPEGADGGLFHSAGPASAAAIPMLPMPPEYQLELDRRPNNANIPLKELLDKSECLWSNVWKCAKCQSILDWISVQSAGGAEALLYCTDCDLKYEQLPNGTIQARI